MDSNSENTKCIEHNALLELLCSNCNILICSQCISSHLSQNHYKIVHITEYCNNTLKNQMIQNISLFVENKEIFENSQKSIDACLDELLKMKIYIKNELEKQLNDLDKSIKILKIYFNNFSGKKTFAGEEKKIKDELKYLEEIIKIKNFELMIKSIKRNKETKIAYYNDLNKSKLDNIKNLFSSIKNNNQIKDFNSYCSDFINYFCDINAKSYDYPNFEKEISFTCLNNIKKKQNSYFGIAQDHSTGLIYQGCMCTNDLNIYASIENFCQNNPLKQIKLQITMGSIYFCVVNSIIFYQSYQVQNEIIKADCNDGKKLDSLDLNQFNFLNASVINYGNPSQICLIENKLINSIYCLYTKNDNKYYFSELLLDPVFQVAPGKSLDMSKGEIGLIFHSDKYFFIGNSYSNNTISKRFNITLNKLEVLEKNIILPINPQIISGIFFLNGKKMIIDEYYTGTYIFDISEK